MRIFAFLLLFIWTSISYAEDLLYYLKKTAKHPNSIDITVRFTGNSDGQTIISLPNVWGGNTKLYQHLSKLHINEQDVSLLDLKIPHKKIIKHKPNQLVTINYQVNQSFTGKPVTQEQAYAPIFQPDYLHFTGKSVMLRPKFKNKESFRTNITWQVPYDWRVASSFGVDKITENFTTNYLELSHGLFIAGDFDFTSRYVNGDKVWLVTQGSFPHLDNEEVVTLAAKIIKAQRDFWNDNSHPDFLMSAITVGKAPRYFGGTSIANAFSMFLPHDMHINTGRGLDWLISHENFHTWNKPLLFDVAGYNERKIYWFTEGITEYYARVFLLREKLMSFTRFVNLYNSMLQNYYLSPVRNISNEQVKTDLRKDKAVKALPYQRGFLLTHNWQVKIRLNNAANSFDNLIKDLIHPGKEIYATHNKLNIAKIDDAAKKYMPHGINADLAQFIDKGVTIQPHPMALGPCCKLVTIKTGKYRPGFLIEYDLKNGVISHVQKDSSAYQAGLRQGQQLLDVEYDAGDVTKPIKVTIKEGNNTKTIEYSALVGKLIDIPQFKLNQAMLAEDPDHCMAWFMPS